MNRAGLLAAVLMMLSGCGSDNPTDPLAQFEPQVANATDSFQLQATDVTDVQTILQYSWENTGTQASVDHSTTTAAGVASLFGGSRLFEWMGRRCSLPARRRPWTSDWAHPTAVQPS